MAKTSRVDRINRWLTLGANIGVVLGLLILTVEVRQNANLSRAAMEADKNALLASIELSMAAPTTAEAWAVSVRAPQKLTDGADNANNELTKGNLRPEDSIDPDLLDD